MHVPLKRLLLPLALFFALNACSQESAQTLDFPSSGRRYDIQINGQKHTFKASGSAVRVRYNDNLYKVSLREYGAVLRKSGVLDSVCKVQPTTQGFIALVSQNNDPSFELSYNTQPKSYSYLVQIDNKPVNVLISWNENTAQWERVLQGKAPQVALPFVPLLKSSLQSSAQALWHGTWGACVNDLLNGRVRTNLPALKAFHPLKAGAMPLLQEPLLDFGLRLLLLACASA